MGIRRLMMLGVLVSFLAATTCAFAEDVFVTKNGTRYHKEVCRLLKNKESALKLEKSKALGDGYGPCRKCFKEDVAVEGDQESPDHVKKGNSKDKKD
jgi:hypothetical protein